MLDIHPPEHTPHTWRDFFIHIATIVLGLVIAIGLEQSVEAIHNHHQAQEARARIRTEVEVNQRICVDDLRDLDVFIAHMTKNLDALQAAAKSNAAKGGATEAPLNFELNGQGFYDAAFHSARESGALARLPYDESAMYSDAYLQGDTTTASLIDSLQKSFAAKAILHGRPLSALSPDEVQSLTAATAAALGEAELTRMNLGVAQQEWGAVRSGRFRNNFGATLQ